LLFRQRESHVRKISTGFVVIYFVSFDNQLVDMFTKSLKRSCVEDIYIKLVSYDIYAFVCGGVLDIRGDYVRYMI